MMASGKDDRAPPVLSVVPSEDQRRRIHVTADEATIVKETILALVKGGGIFQRAGFLVEPRVDPARGMPNLIRPTEELRMVAIKPARLRTLSTEHCFFYHVEKGAQVNCSPPNWLASAVIAEPEWHGIPVVESVSENPTLRADGTIHDVPGYDPSSGNYFAADEDFPQVPENPTIEEARAAYEALMEPFVDFPFVSESDRSVAAAIVLTLLARPAIHGAVPPFVIRTPTPRTGKDLLTDVIATIGVGRPTPGRSLPTNDEELKKVLLSLGLSGCRIASFGNCEGAIGSPVLSHAVTREAIAERLLSVNTDVVVPLRLVWLFNGNNPRFKGDFGPRVVTCDMDAGTPDPQSRMGWKHDPLLPYVQKKRPELVAAGLTILRAYCAAGRPRHGKPRKGSFEAWDDLVRGALVWAGAADPVGSISAVEAVSVDDADIEQLRALLTAWRAAFDQRPTTLAEAVNAVRDLPTGAPSTIAVPQAAKTDLSAAFSSLDARLGDRYTAASLRYYFRHNRGRPVDVEGRGDPSDVLRLEVENPRSGPSKVASWWVLDGTIPKGGRPTVDPRTAPPPTATSGGKSLFDGLPTAS